MKNTQKTLKTISLILLAATLLLVFYVNLLIPFMMDDMWYSTLLYSPEKVSSFSDIVKAQVWHWHNWGGRSITHAILQFILMNGERFADVLNTVFVLLLSAVIVILSFSSSEKKENIPAYLFATAALIIGLSANWKMSMFWEAGAANYLYITVFIIRFLWCYLREIEGDARPLPFIVIWMIPLAVVSGWSNENMGPVCFIISLIVIYLMKKRSGKIPVWMIEGAVFSLAGSIMCIIAPGNMIRKAETEQGIGILWKTFLRFYYEFTALFKFQFLSLLTLTAVLVTSIFICGISLKESEKILLLGAFLSWGAMFLSPHYPDRATFGTMCLIITVIISRSALIIQKKKEAASALYTGMILIWLKGLYDLGDFIANYNGWLR